MNRTLYMQVLDYDRFSRDDPIGEICLPLSDVDLIKEQTLWMTLQPCKGHTVSATSGQGHFGSGLLRVRVTSGQGDFGPVPLLVRVTSGEVYFGSGSLGVRVTSGQCHFWSGSLRVRFTSGQGHF